MSTPGQIPPSYDASQSYPPASNMAGENPPKYDPTRVYQQAFRHVRPPYPALALQSNTLGLSVGLGSIKALRGSFRLASKLGAEYTCPTKFKFLGRNGLLEEWQVPQEPSTSVRGGKNIVETQLTRFDSKSKKKIKRNVIEEIGLNNYRIQMRGVIINESDDDAYPYDAVATLRDVAEATGSVEIINWHVNQFGVSSIVIEDFDFFEINGFPNAQAFELSAIGDEAVELELVNEPERL